ncbi:MAG: stage IV sporulation protein A [Clostridia bacterium]
MDRSALYKDIAERTDGDIYIGVVGPVRTGKSTFIKRFMDLLVIPNMHNEFAKGRAIDELPQSAAGKTIMTTQPKFVPNEAAEVYLDGAANVRLRMVDCVGYMVPGAVGHIENEVPRMVRTPWFDYDIPFEEAAEIGTRKVITEHSTIGVVITTDGSITQIPRDDYVKAEERVICELNEQSKPFAIVLNSTHPQSEETVGMAEKLSEKYGTVVKPMDVMNMSATQINELLEDILMEFPVRMIHINVPSWMCALPYEHWLMQRVLVPVTKCTENVMRMRDCAAMEPVLGSIEDFEPASTRSMLPGSGMVEMELRPLSEVFYKVLGEECGCEIEDDAHLISIIKEFVGAKREYDRVSSALDSAYKTGYGMVSPPMEEMVLDKPEVVQRGNRFGVRLNAHASGLHLIRVDIDSEVSPLVGSEEQSEEFLSYLMESFEKEPDKVWQTKIFGKPLYDLIKDDMSGKVARMPPQVQQRLQSTLQRMVNDGCNGLICILL